MLYISSQVNEYDKIGANACLNVKNSRETFLMVFKQCAVLTFKEKITYLWQSKEHETEGHVNQIKCGKHHHQTMELELSFHCGEQDNCRNISYESKQAYPG